ncbi:HNH endonuclease family protein [Nocardia paucivorans]|uniref:HNH endonuclease family protein n=1 Tax=Nocardia paucivorans TaxID=114259 RepID=UPI0002DFA30E|nr:HNH endonuclease family protein [Nocardia paucivorans]
MIKRIGAAAGSILIAVVVAVGCSLLEDPTDPNVITPDTADPSAVSAQEVLDALGKLPVGKEVPMAGYSREEFPHWDNNDPEHGFGPEFAQYQRCTTREVMMLRDSTGTVTLDPKTCDLKVGKDGGWRDHYGVLDRKTGQLQPYKWITEPSKVDAEHIVPLAEAWRSGAGKLDKDTRRRIANDAVNLVASDPSANRSKGDQDPADYLPPGEFRCSYIDRYIKIKLKYGLSVDSDEQTALRTAVDDCVKRGEFK